MQKVTAIFVGFLLLISSHLAYAVGLGSIHLYSDLNEPLYAEIEIIDSDKVTTDELSVSLASEQIFADTGVEYSSYLSKLQFRILEGPHGKVVQVSTEQAVSQPYYNFLVEMHWTQGHLSRQYTLLLDPKGFPARNPAKTDLPSVRDQVEALEEKKRADKQADKQAENQLESTSDSQQRVEQSATLPTTTVIDAATTKQQNTNQIVPAAPAAEPVPANSAPVMQFASKYGPVSAHDQLWRIARKVRPKGVSLEQTIMSVYYANESAFSHQNINLLQKGQVLNIPVAEDMANIPQSVAKKELVEHIRTWQTGAYMQVSSITSPNAAPANNVMRTASAANASQQTPAADSHENQNASAVPVSHPETNLPPATQVVSPTNSAPHVNDKGAQPSTMTSSATLPVIPSFSENTSSANNGSPQITPIESHGLESNKVQLASSGDVNETINTLQAELAVTAQNLKMAEQQSQQMKLKFDELERKSNQLQQQIEEKDKLLLQLQQQLESDHGNAKPNVGKQNTDPAAKPIAQENNTASSGNKGANSNAPKTSSQASVNEMPSSTHSLNQLIILFAAILVAGVLGLYFWNSRSQRKQQKSLGAAEEPHLDSDEVMAAKTGPAKTVAQEAKQPPPKLVDPFEEATVYLAYNRHSQAEKVLLDGLRDYPEREDFKVLLLEVYASLGDRQQFAIWDSTLDMSELEASRPDLYAKVIKMRALVTGEKPVETLAPVANVSAPPPPPASAPSPVVPKPIEPIVSAKAPEPVVKAAEAAPVATAKLETESEPDTEAEDSEKPDTISFEFTKIEAKPAKAPDVQPNADQEEEEAGLTFESVAIKPAPAKSEPQPQKTTAASPANGPLELLDEELSNEMQFDGVVDADDSEAEIEYKPLNAQSEEFSISAAPEEDEGLQAGESWQAEANESGDYDGQLDLAIAYIEIEDFDGAKDLLNLVASKGDSFQQKRAQELLADLASKGH